MSRKISEFFKPKLEPESNPSEAAVKHEEEGNFVINLDEIEKEIKIEENSPKIRECRVMLKDFKKEVKENVEDHEGNSDLKAKIMDENDNKCEFCRKTFSSKGTLMRHQRKFHSNEIKNLLSCRICGAKFFKKYKFERHMKTKHFIDVKIEEHFECDFDGKIFSTRQMLCSHMQSHQMTIRCELCQAEVKPFSMNEHKRSVHSTGRKFQCKICSKSFKALKNLSNHEKSHNKKFNCEICNKKFTIIYTLTKHKKEYHENPEIFECPICGKKFNRKEHLKNHEKTHDKNRPKPFKCQRCDFATDNPQSYKYHQNSHRKKDKKFAAMKNPIKCEKCSTFCRNKQFLLQHMKVVHPVKLFQCDLCGKYAKVFKDLKKHLKIHQNLQKL